MPDTILINSKNPNDITLEEGEEIAEMLRRLHPDCDVQVLGQQRDGTGVTWFEVLYISLGFAAKELVQQAVKMIADSVIAWVRERFKKLRVNSKRPVYVVIYGPDGEIVKSVLVRNATEEPEDRTEEDRKQRLKLK